jgi:hypothetical protein
MNKMRFVWVVHFDDRRIEEFTVQLFDRIELFARKKDAKKFVKKFKKHDVSYILSRKKINESYTENEGE